MNVVEHEVEINYIIRIFYHIFNIDFHMSMIIFILLYRIVFLLIDIF